jgi:uncharacterized protein (UPF0332 family)
MSFDWDDYILLAKNLSGLGTDAARRSAVSRAYYCAFHAAALSLENNKIATNPKYTRDRHLRVWNIYIESANRECRRIGNGGQRLKIERHEADYDPGSDFTNIRVQRCIAQAETLLEGIRANVPEGYSTTRGRVKRALSYIRRLL